jgi:hypothetical protein
VGCKHQCAALGCSVGIGLCGGTADGRDGEGDENERYGWRGMRIHTTRWDITALNKSLIFPLASQPRNDRWCLERPTLCATRKASFVMIETRVRAVNS